MGCPQKVAQESPPPPTFTVPAFRARQHRGGESELLKDVYPSGFCKPPENRPLPTTTKTVSTTSNRRTTLSGPHIRDLLQESKEVGVPPCGATAGRQALNITRVVLGAKDVVDTIGSELVQYGGFSVGPAELSSPTSINRPHHSRPPSPASPSRMTIDGSALLRGRSSLLVEARSVVNRWPGRKTCAPGDFASPRDESSNTWKGRKRIRSATTDRAQSSGGPEPWPYPAEALTGCSSRPSTSASAIRGGAGGLAAAAPRGDNSNAHRGREDPGRPVDGENTPENGVGGIQDQNTQRPADTTNEVGQLGLLGAQDNSSPAQEDGQAGCRNEMAEKLEGELALMNEDHPKGSSRVDAAWANAKDYPSVWSDADGSACFASGGTNNNNHDNSVVCDSSVADDSAEQVAGKRSFSTLDTERYRGSLSKDATNILRSHLELRNKPPNTSTSCVSDSSNATGTEGTETEGTTLMSPAPPPTPPGQVRPEIRTS